jgi:hypothetical protein
MYILCQNMKTEMDTNMNMLDADMGMAMDIGTDGHGQA